MKTTQERMSAFVDRIEARLEHRGECWIWHNSDRRVSFRYGEIVRKLPVRSVLYEQQFGLIPEGMRPHPRCSNETCVKPEHMDLRTHSEIAKATSRVSRVQCQDQGCACACHLSRKQTQEEPRSKIPFDVTAANGMKMG